jgi:hypothetical protein
MQLLAVKRQIIRETDFFKEEIRKRDEELRSKDEKIKEIMTQSSEVTFNRVSGFVYSLN